MIVKKKKSLLDFAASHKTHLRNKQNQQEQETNALRINTNKAINSDQKAKS